MLVNRHINYHGVTITGTFSYISDLQHKNTMLVTSFDIPKSNT